MLSLLLVGCGAPMDPPPTTQPAPVAAGTPLPVTDELVRVWAPSGGRYVNEPTLVRDEATGRWHVFANGGTGPGEPYVERQILHASAPSLRGPWTEHPDALTTSDPGATEVTLHAPYAFRDGDLWRMLYYDGTRPAGEGLHAARSTDLDHWTRDPDPYPGGRDAFVLRLSDGRDLLYTVGVAMEGDGPHDTVDLHAGRSLTAWRDEGAALRNPLPCPRACWGWYESPFVLAHDGAYYLFVTFTSSLAGADDYERTQVFRSTDPARFGAAPVATLRGHGAELHEEDGALYLTAGGWPGRVGEARRGLSIARVTWRRAP